MPIETRASLDASSNVVRTETNIGANTAKRIGDLFRALSDSAVLLAERGYVSASSKAPATFTVAAADTPEKLTYTMALVLEGAYNTAFESSPSVSWNGDAAIAYRVSAMVNFDGSNSKEYYFYIAKDGVIDETTKVSVHLSSPNPHSISLELFSQGAHSYEIYIEEKGGTHPIDIINAQLNLMSL
jgi:hypothetical protein